MTTHAQAPPTAGSRTLRLSLLPADACEPVEVVVQVPEGACWGEARAALAEAGVAAPAPSYIGAEEVFDSDPIGELPLLNHAVIAAAPTATEGQHLLSLVAVEGPCVGARTPLTGDVRRVGRALDAQLSLPDPDLSRNHLLVSLEHGRAVVTDAGSTNGTRLDGVVLAAGVPSELRAGTRLRAGSTTFALERRAPAPVVTTCDDTCRIPVQRPPRRAPALPVVELTRPTAPTAEERRRLPWAMLLMPLVLAGVLLLVLRNPLFLMFALLSPVMMLGQHLSDRKSGSQRTRDATHRHDTAVREMLDRRDAALIAELALRRVLTPPLTETLRAAVARDVRLWARAPDHDDFLTCRVGTGIIDSQVRVRDTHDDRSPCVERLQEAPIAVPLGRSRVLGVAAAAPERARLADAVVLQLATWQSPHHLRIVVLCATAAERARWRWAIPLPHLTIHPQDASTLLDFETDDEACASVILALLPEEVPPGRSQDDPTVHTVIVLDGVGALATRPEVTRLLREGPRAGVSIVALAGDAAALPAECSTTVRVDGPTAIRVDGDTLVTGRPDLPTPDLCRAVARQLAGLTDATPDTVQGVLPTTASLLDLWRAESLTDPTDAESVAARWAEQSGTTRAPLGLGPTGPLTVDLATDGPHALIAGTTGAGKSELLQTMVTSLALGNRPDELVFVLIDYKGGAAFQDCAALPHAVGLVTDLDAHLTERALESLDAEVRRRERLLAAAGAKDLEDYRRVAGSGLLARLVLVIDEFRVLAEELPDFIAGLVRLAAVGRSLGIHLVLATQRPAGVVSADIRANVNLRIALRVRDEADSQDVIGSNLAAHLSAAQPGRAIVRTGGGAPVDFQTARIAGRSHAADDDVRVGLVARPGDPPTWSAKTLDDDGPTDLQQTVAAIRAATERQGVVPPPSPWLAPLPHRLVVEELDGERRTVLGTPALPESVDFARADLPADQATRTVAWAPDSDGHLAIVGGPRSGRTTAIRTLAVQAARLWPDGGLAIYVVDGSSSLAGLSALPQVGAVIPRDEVGRLVRLIEWLGGEIQQRQQAIASSGSISIADHLTTNGSVHRILVLVDGWETFTEVSDDVTLGRLTDDLLQVLRDGAAVGIHAIVTGGRGLFSGRVASAFSSRLVLRLADPSDAGLLGLRPVQLPDSMPPGRALVAPDGTELQIAELLPVDSKVSFSQCVSSLAASMSAHGVRRFESIPESCSVHDLPRTEGEVAVGIGGVDPTPIGIALGAAGDLAALIAGPPRSGRTTALRTLAQQLSADRPVGWLPGRTTPGSLPSAVLMLDPDQPEQLADWLGADPRAAILADDFDELIGAPVEDLVLAHLSRSRPTGGIVCVSGQTSTLIGAFRGVVAELRRRQTGIILQPGRRDGELLGTDTGPPERPRPGRGALVIRGRAVEIQVATDPTSPTDNDDVGEPPQGSS
ncbi:FtsK/SpoIIIE domain-containing protein [Flexivirga meconopsidis]|uniref:FtsK/SpoIIIE domain-containing protein n=1 Tax=Flexivirga meconopsidis TaxID=2977121 RepID=UPI002240559E|nr:FtsK/SpoIIIE domain-containing protein [Flexivirga meconopsidis]